MRRTAAAVALALATLAAAPAAWSLPDVDPAVAPTRPSSRLIHLEGPIRLTGTGYAAAGADVAVVTLKGSVQVSDPDGDVRTGPTPVVIRGVVDVSRPLMTQWAHPTLYIFVERGGRVAAARLDGDVPFSGSARDGAVTLTGAGLVSGDVLVQGP